MFCPYCGVKMNEGEAFCRSCGKNILPQFDSNAPQGQPIQRKETNFQDTHTNITQVPDMKMSGSIGAGVVVGFFLLLIIGWIPIIGALISGIAAGATARGALRGMATGFIAGIIGAIAIGILLTTVGTSIGGIIGGIIGMGIGTVLLLLSIGGAILSMMGGFIGGALRSRTPRYY